MIQAAGIQRYEHKPRSFVMLPENSGSIPGAAPG